MIHYRLYLNLISFSINAIFWPRSHPGFHVARSMSFMMLTLQESSSQWSGFMWCFLVIKLRLCTFGKSATQVMLCLPQVPGGVCVLSRSVCIWLFTTPRAVAHQAPLSMGFSLQKYWSGLPFPSPGGLPDPGLSLHFLRLLHWQMDSLSFAPVTIDFLPHHLGSPGGRWC